MPWKCFVAEETDLVQIYTRRYGAGIHNCRDSLTGKVSYHNAEAVIAPEVSGVGLELIGREPEPIEKRELLWPTHCKCGYAFHPEDNWQYNIDSLYRNPLNGKLFRLRNAEPGAMWRARWLENLKDNRYANDAGEVWALMLPGGDEWLIYSKVGYPPRRWEIQGQLPRITVSPSIRVVGKGSYHGYVKDGIITDDCEGHTFPEWPSTA